MFGEEHGRASAADVIGRPDLEAVDIDAINAPVSGLLYQSDTQNDTLLGISGRNSRVHADCDARCVADDGGTGTCAYSPV